MIQQNCNKINNISDTLHFINKSFKYLYKLHFIKIFFIEMIKNMLQNIA